MSAFAKITPELIEQYQTVLQEIHSEASYKRKLSSLNKFLSWAQDKGYLTENPLNNQPQTQAQETILPEQDLPPLPTLPAQPQTAPISAPPITSETTIVHPLTATSSASTLAWAKGSLVVLGLVTAVGLSGLMANSYLNGKSPFAPFESLAQFANEDGNPIAQINTKTSPSPTPQAQTGTNQEEAITATPAPEAQTLDTITAKTLDLISSTPVIQALGGPLLLNSAELILKTDTASDGNITLSPDGEGQILLRSSTTSKDSLNIQNANLTSGSLISGYVGNNGTGFDLLSLSSGSTAREVFEVDAQGNTTIQGNALVQGNQTVNGTLSANQLSIRGSLDLTSDLKMNGVTRLTSSGRLASITGYYQDSGLFEIDQGSPDQATITKEPSSSQGPATADSVIFTLDESNTTSSAYDTLVLNRINGATGANALYVKQGNAQFDGNVNINGTLTTGGSGGLSTSNLTVTGTSDLQGDVYNSTGNLNLADAVVVTSTIGVTGATTLSSTLTTSGAATFASTVGITGATTLSSTLNVSGASTLAALSATTGSFSSTLGVTGIATFAANVNANGGFDVDDAFVIADGGALTTSGTAVFNNTVTANSFSSSGATITGGTINGTIIGGSTPAAGTFTTLTGSSLSVTNNATVGGTLGVTGAATFSSTIASGAITSTGTSAFDAITVGGGFGSTGVTVSSTGNIQMDGNLTVGGTATFNGLVTNNSNTTLGDTASDTITFVGVVNSNITPETNNTYNFGSSGTRWATGYFNTIDASTIVGTVAGGSTTSNSWTINSDNATANAEIGSLAFETGSNPINAVLQWNASGDAGRVTGHDNANLFNYPVAIYSQVSGANQTFTSGSLFKYGQNATHAITQSAAFLGFDVDFSSNITVPDSANGNQTGSKVTLKDGGASATAIGYQTAGTLDYGIDLDGTIGTADIRLQNDETISNTSDGIIALGGNVTTTGNLNVNSGSGTITSGLINGQTISSTANFTGTVAIATSLSINGGTALTTTNQTGTGSLVLASSPTITSPTFTGTIATALTASRAVFTDGSGNLAVSGASSALSSSLTDETGSGSAVFATAPSVTTLTVSSGGAAITGNSSVAGILTINNGGSTLGQELRFSNTAGNRWATFGSQYSSAAPFLAYNAYQTDAGNGSGSDNWTQNGSGFISTLVESNNTYPLAIYKANAGTSAAAKATFFSTSSPLIQLDSAGQFGIGVSPTYKLQVAGNAYISNGLTVGGNGAAITGNTTVTGNIVPGTNDTYDLGSTGSRWANLYLGAETLFIGTSATDEGTISYNTTSNIFQFGTDSTTNGDIAFFTDDLYLDKSAGSVGIGTTGPTEVLDVVGNTKVRGTLRIRSSSNTGNLNILDAGGGTATIDNSGNSFLNIASASNTNISSGTFTVGYTSTAVSGGVAAFNGSVGIGTASPAATLNVTNGSNLTAYLDETGSGDSIRYPLYLRNAATPTTTGGGTGLQFYGRTLNGTAVEYAQINTVQSAVTNAAQSGALAFYTANAGSVTEKLRIDNAGNVGIGTTSPDTLLDITGSYGSIGQMIVQNTTADVGLRLSADTANGNADADTFLEFFNDGSRKFTIGYDDTNDNFHIANGTITSNSILTISGAGLVAISDTTPDASLEIVNDGSGDSFLVADTNDGDTTPFVINSSGNVGIGTASPTGAQLAIMNATQATVNTLFAAGYNPNSPQNRQINMAQILNASTGNQFIFLNGTLGSSSAVGTPTLTSTFAPSFGIESNDSNMSLITAAAGTNVAVTRALSITSAGLIGIGTISPDAQNSLHVKGNILAENGANTTGTVRNKGFNLWTDEAFGMELLHNGSWRTAIYTRSNDSDIAFGAYAANATAQNTFSEYMTIDGTTGRVGIGTTSPDYNLEVEGATDPRISVVDTTNSVKSHLLASDSLGYVGTQSNHAFRLMTNDIERFDIDTSGNFAIGTSASVNTRYMFAIGGAGDTAYTSTATSTNDSALLLVRPSSIANTAGTGDISNTHIWGVSLNPVGASTTGSTLRVGAPSEGGAGSFTNMASIYVEGGPSAGTNNYALWVDDGTTRLDGNLTVGGTSITATSADISAGRNLTLTHTTNPFIRLVKTNATAQSWDINGGDSFQITDVTRGVSPLTIATTGAVSIIAPTSTTALTVGGAANSTALSVNSSTSAGAGFGALIRGGTNSSDYALQVRSANDSSSYLYVRGDGNVGIGTTSPSSTLDLVGRLEIQAISNTNAQVVRGVQMHDSYIIHDGNQTTTDGLVFANIDYSPYSFHWGKYTLADGSLKDNLSNFTPQMTLTNGGNLGVGTTAPAERLAVKDNGYGGSHVFGVHADDANPWLFGFFNDTYSTTVPGLKGYVADAGDTYIGTQGAGDDLNFFVANNYPSPTLTIKASNASVGIGTASPDNNLHVLGATSAAGIIKVDVTTAGQQARVDFADADNTKWMIGKDASNNFFIWDPVNSRNSVNFYSSGSTVFNDDSADIDFRIESDTNASAFVLDAGLDVMGFGTSVSGDVKYWMKGSLTGSTNVHGLVVDPTLTTPSNGVGRVAQVQGTIVEASSGTHASLYGLNVIAPTVTSGAASVTNTATLYVSGAMSATVTGTNYAFWAEGAGLFGTPDTNEVLLGMSANTSGHEGIGIFHNGTEGFIQSIDAGVAWHDLTIQADEVRLDLAGSTDNYVISATSITTSADLTIAPSGGDLDVNGRLVVGNQGPIDTTIIFQAYHDFTNSSGNEYGAYIQPAHTTNTTTGTLYGVYVNNIPFTGGITVAENRGIHVTNPGGTSTVTTNYGISIAAQTRGTTDYGLYIGGADTQALWVDSGTFRFDSGGVINEDSNDSDFRIEGDTNANLVYVDAGQDNIGLGGAPLSTAMLDIAKTYSSATTGEQYGIYNSTYFSIADTGLKQGIRSNAIANHSTGAVANLIGNLSLPQHSGTSTSSVTSAYGYWTRIDNNNATGTITNAYGLYIADSTETGTITNDYGVYQVDTGAFNYFGGNVGIGTTSPAEKFVVGASRFFVHDAVDNNVNVGINRAATTNYGYLNFQTAGADKWYVGLTNDSTDSFRLDATGATRNFTIGNANVGIGTTGPDSKLHLAQDSASTYGGQLKISGASDETDAIFVNWDSANQYGAIATMVNGVGTGNLVFQQNGGNVGIGTTSPDTMLDIEAVANAFLRITDTTSTVQFQAQANDSNARAGTNSAHDFYLMRGGTDEVGLSTTALFPATSDGNALGSTSNMWSDLFLASGAVTNYNNGDVLITHGTNQLQFSGATSGYTFDNFISPISNDGATLGTTSLKWADLFLASGSVINLDSGDVTITHSSNALAFAGASSGYSFDSNIVLASGNKLKGTAPSTGSGNTTGVAGIDTSSENLVLNSSFLTAASSGYRVWGWTDYGWCDDANTDCFTNAASPSNLYGSTAARIQIHTSTTTQYHIINQRIPWDATNGYIIRPNTTYVLSGWVYVVSNPTGAFMRVDTHHIDTTGVSCNLANSVNVTTTGSWQRVQVVFTTPNATGTGCGNGNFGGINVLVATDGRGVAHTLDTYFDGIMVEEGTVMSNYHMATRDQSSITTTQADVAEYYYTSETTQQGDIVSIDKESDASKVERSTKEYDNAIIGIHSTNPGITLGGDWEGKGPDGTIPVALNGRVPVKVTTKNGPILSGDTITSSDLPGIGMIAKKAGTTIAKALEGTQNWSAASCPAVSSVNEIAWPQDDGTNKNRPCFTLPDGSFIGKVMAFVSLSTHDPDMYLTSTGELHISQTAEQYALQYEEEGSTQLIDRVGAFGELVVAKLTAGIINTSELIAESVESATVIADSAQIGLLETDRLVSPVVEVETLTASEKLISPLVETDKAVVNELLSNNVIAGEATVSGTLDTNNLITNNIITNDATVGGTLYADRIKANEIEGLSGTFEQLIASSAATQNLAFEEANRTSQSIIDRIRERVSSLEEDLQEVAQNNVDREILREMLVETASTSPSLALESQGWTVESEAQTDINLTGSLNVLANLNIFGTTQLSNTQINGTVNITQDDTQLLLTPDTLAAVGTRFSIFASEGVDIMNGALIVDAGGNVLVQQNLIAQGTIQAQEFAPLEDQDLTLNLQNGESNYGELKIAGEQGQTVASIDKDGATTLSQLIIASDNTVEASSLTPGEITTNATAGEATLSSGSTELTIRNPKVTDKTLIYVTPTSPTQNKVLYVKSKLAHSASSGQAGAFVVGVDTAATVDIKFNWWIIELKN